MKRKLSYSQTLPTGFDYVESELYIDPTNSL